MSDAPGTVAYPVDALSVNFYLKRNGVATVQTCPIYRVKGLYRTVECKTDILNTFRAVTVTPESRVPASLPIADRGRGNDASSDSESEMVAEETHSGNANVFSLSLPLSLLSHP